MWGMWGGDKINIRGLDHCGSGLLHVSTALLELVKKCVPPGIIATCLVATCKAYACSHNQHTLIAHV